MSYAVQVVVVALLVIFATVFATWRLMGGALRLRTVEALLRALPGNAWLESLAAKQRAATGCSACERNTDRR